jgi:hypothetical protein
MFRKRGDIGRLDLARQFIKYIFQIRKWMLPNVFHDFLIQISITCFRFQKFDISWKLGWILAFDHIVISIVRCNHYCNLCKWQQITIYQLKQEMKTLSAICLFIYHWPSILESPEKDEHLCVYVCVKKKQNIRYKW